MRVVCKGVAGLVWRSGLAEAIDVHLLVATADWYILDVFKLEGLLGCCVCCLIAWNANMTRYPIEHGFLVRRVAVVQELADGSKQEMVVCWSVLLDHLDSTQESVTRSRDLASDVAAVSSTMRMA